MERTSNERRLRIALLGLLGWALASCATEPVPERTSRDVARDFRAPPTEYASAPLWVWNDRLTEEQIRGTLRDLAAQKVLQVFVHPRPGLMTPYLSAEWFRLWKIALDEASKLDMNVWIYDENSYPSGFAGGFVPEVMPESRGRGLHFREATSPPESSDATVGVFPQEDGKYLVAEVRRAPDSPWHGGRSYVDLLYPGVTEKFLEITLDAYEREVGSEFGKRIPGSFTDEPQLVPAGGLPWTKDLPEAFKTRWGYDLVESLPSLTRPVGDWRRVRHNYYQTLLDLFIERWAKPYYEYCEGKGLEFTGHYWEHEWPRCLLVPDNMALSAWQQRPGIDTLMNRYAEDTHAQFGNVRAVREISSLANQLGRKRTLCEAYGAGGWDLRFADMKRIADWLYVLGVNTLDEHLSYITLRGARKKDHPQSFSYHEPWWSDYHVRATYASRLSAALSQGEQVNPFLVLEPTTTAWLYQADGSQASRLDELGNRFQDLLLDLERRQVEYDLGCEDVLARHGSVAGRNLVVGERSYGTVVLPPLTENVNKATARLLEAFVRQGGTILCCGEPPAFLDGKPSKTLARASDVPSWRRVEPTELAAQLLKRVDDGFKIERAEGDEGILLHHRRRLPDGELLFLVNTSDAVASSGSVEAGAGGVERWDLETGEVSPCDFVRQTGGAGDPKVSLPFELAPCGSLLLFLSREPREPMPKMETVVRTIEPRAAPETRRLASNVLVLDYVDVAVGDETQKSAYVYAAGQFAFQKNGLERNPWDSAVQFRDELISRTFPPESGVRATYRFTIEEEVPERIWAVVEHPELYDITLNDFRIRPEPGAWWLDRSFGKLDLAPAAKLGENVLELVASPFRIEHEIESVYIVGEFGVRPAESGFVVGPAQEVKLGAWNQQGMPFYGDTVSYTEEFDVGQPLGTYRVSMPQWYGSVARVTVNGHDAGVVEVAPWERDVTPWIREGRNTIEVVVVGTLKNTLGPHHGNPELGLAWPGMFHQAPDSGPPPGETYSTVGYGLFKPFVLLEERDTEAMTAEPDASSDGIERARATIRAYERTIVPLETALAYAWWDANTTGKDEDFQRKEDAQNRLDEALSNRKKFTELKDLRVGIQKLGTKVDATLARQIELLYLRMVEKQVDPDILRQISAKSNSVEKAFNVFRAKVGGAELTDSEVRKGLKESTNSADRKELWEASKDVGRVVEADLKDLIRLRNEAAKQLGFGNYHAMQLELSEQSQEQVLRLFDELESLTREPFREAKAGMDAKLAAACGVEVSELRPWHYHDPFFQEAPAIYATDLDAAYSGQELAALCEKFYAGVGLSVSDVLARSDLFERDGKSPHAFCTDIDRQGDVRVLANIVPNEYWMGTMLHELGHAVYSSKFIPPSRPYLLRAEAAILCTEGIAMLFEKFSKSAKFLQQLGVTVSDPEAFDATARKLHRDRLLVFAAWCQVMLRFEVALYENPDQDLNKLWWDLVERYQEVHRPEGRDAPDYAAKIHVVSAPAYYHNYLMGELFASQLHAAIAREVLKADPRGATYNDRTDVGDFLKSKVFEPGRTLKWNELTRYATGRELNAEAFAAQIR